MRPPDYLLTQRPWQLPPWTTQLGNTSILNIPPPPQIQLSPPPPQVQLRLPDWGDLFPRRGGTRTDIAPTYQPQFDIKTWLEAEQIKNMPPGLRELYAALLGAGRYAVITPSLDVLSRWLRGEDPTRGLEEFQRKSEAAAYASPWGHLVGQGVGLAGVAGLTAEGLIARGVGATNLERLLSGLRTSLKPAAVGAGVGAGAGATEGVLTGRDPFAEAAKYGSVGFMTGLGRVPWERLAAAGLLGAAVGGSTAKEYGVGKGLEAGSTVFLLPIIAPVERGLGGIAMGTRRGLRTELLTEPGVTPPQPRVELPTMQDIRTYMLLTRRSFSDVVADMARQATPEGRRDLFTNVVETALDRLRAGYDRDAVLAVLRNVRQKLDPALRAQFDEVLKQYGLTEVKYTTPEYQLTEESATALRQFLKTRTPEYALTDESAKLLDNFLKPRQEPQYALTDEAAALLDQFLRQESPRSYMLLRTRSEPEYQTALELNRRQVPQLTVATQQDQLLRQKYVVMPRTAQPTIGTTSATGATAQTGATTTQTTTANTTQIPNNQTSTTTTTATSTVVNERNVLQFVPYLPPQLLAMPVAVALPAMVQIISQIVGAPVTLRLPPPPNPNMSLGSYLRMLRLPGTMGRQREVYVLI